MKKKEKMIICIMGPTGSGKTELAVKLTQELPLDIVSVDSAMVYRGAPFSRSAASPSVAKAGEAAEKKRKHEEKITEARIKEIIERRG